MEAVSWLRLYPTEIEADLYLRNVDIHDWHQGTLREDGARKLSSRRLLILIHKLPDDSEFKREAYRNGDWTDRQYTDAGILNEIRLLRTDFAAMHGNTMDPVLVESPRQAAASASEARFKAKVRSRISQQLNIGRQAENG